MNDWKLAIIGAGTMGRALGGGLLGTKTIAAGNLTGTIRHEHRVEEVRKEVGFPIGTDNVAAAKGAEVVLLATKPKMIPEVTREISQGGGFEHGPLVISVAAGVKTTAIEAIDTGSLRVVRAMPNTPCLIGEGMTVVSGGLHATDEDLVIAEQVFQPLGRVRRLEEEHMDTVTGLSGSGPAFVYVMIEALSEGGVMMGLPRHVATELASQTVRGAASMVLETGLHPAQLKDDVLTPAGCTISGLLAMEDGGIRSVIARGVERAARAAAGLGAPRTDA